MKFFNRQHDTRTPSLSVKPGANFAKDFGDPQLQGGPAEMIMGILNVNELGAADWLKREMGITIPVRGGHGQEGSTAGYEKLKTLTEYAAKAHEALIADENVVMRRNLFNTRGWPGHQFWIRSIST